MFPNVLNVARAPVHVCPYIVPGNNCCSSSFLQARKKEKPEAAFVARQAALLAAHQGVGQDPPSPKGPPLLMQLQKADEA